MNLNMHITSQSFVQSYRRFERNSYVHTSSTSDTAGLLPNHDLLFARYAITLQKKNPEIPKTIRNQRLLASVRRKNITGNDCRDKKAGWE